MAEPTSKVRRGTYQRDWNRCLSCGRQNYLSYQHRQATGMGGSKHRPTFAEGITACLSCNERFEHELQTKALRYGWKVRGWVRNVWKVPVFDTLTGCWFLLSEVSPARSTISHAEARKLMLQIYGEEYEEWCADG